MNKVAPRCSWKAMALLVSAGIAIGLIALLMPNAAAAPKDPLIFDFAAAGDLDALRIYQLNGGNIRVKNYFDRNMLFPALLHKQWRTADYLFDCGLRFEEPIWNGERMSEAFVGDDYTDVMVWFIKHGLSTDFSDSDGEFELHKAAERGGPKTTMKLLEAGFDPLKRNTKGETPEMVAERNKNWAVSRIIHSWLDSHLAN